MGRYRIEGLIGRGSCGLVFRARDLGQGTVVALKEFGGGVRGDGFLRELGLMFELHHPHVVGCHSVFMAEGYRYLVLEHLEGGTLRARLGADGFDARKGLRWLLHACEGVAYAHERSVIHRDLKPENILLARRGERWLAKVADFGMAALCSTSSAPTGVGSPAYMAPEQFYERCDPRADVYALGVIGYEVICGRRPFLGTSRQVMHGHLHQALMLPRWLPALTRRCLHRALAKDPADRQRNAAELRAELGEVLALDGLALARMDWPVAVGSLDQLAATHELVLGRQGSSLLGFDRRGRLVERLEAVNHVVARDNYYLHHHEGRWCLVSPVGKRVLAGLPFTERIGVSANGDVICVLDGGAHLVLARNHEQLHPSGSGVVDACFVGHRQQPCVVGTEDERGWLEHRGQRMILPGRPARVHGHSELEHMIVRSSEDHAQLWHVSERGISSVQVACGDLTCDRQGFVAVGFDGRLVRIDCADDRATYTRLEVPVRMSSSSSELGAWLGDDGRLRLLPHADEHGGEQS